MVNLDNVSASACVMHSLDMNTYELHLNVPKIIIIHFYRSGIYISNIIHMKSCCFFFPHAQRPYAYHVAFYSFTLILKYMSSRNYEANGYKHNLDLLIISP